MGRGFSVSELLPPLVEAWKIDCVGLGGAGARIAWTTAAWAARIMAAASAFLVFYAVLYDEGILRYFFNTFLVAAATAALVPLFVLPAAWALSRANPRRSAKVFAFLQALGMTGGIHSPIPLFIVFRILGLLGGYLPLVTVYLFHAVPFSLFTLKAFLDRLPPSYEEAAALEGVGPLAYMARIVAPLCAPAWRRR